MTHLNARVRDRLQVMPRLVRQLARSNLPREQLDVTLNVSERGPQIMRHRIREGPEFGVSGVEQFVRLLQRLCLARQLGLHALLLADVRDCAQHADRLSLFIALDFPPRQDPTPYLIRPGDLAFKLESVRAKCFLKTMSDVL